MRMSITNSNTKSILVCSLMLAWGIGFSPMVQASSFRPSTIEFKHKLLENLEKVEEFKFIRNWAHAKGIPVWLAGGTAAGYGTYVRDQIENQWLKAHQLQPRFVDERFSYHYYDIYRSTQDCDLVIDGTIEDAEALEAALEERYFYVKGEKAIWEVRLLNTPRGQGAGEKDPLLSPHFQNQNSDSLSTGMI